MTILNQICDYIILISGVLVQITGISAAIGKPIKWLKKYREKSIQETLEVTLPSILEKHDAQIKNALNAQIAEAVSAELKPIQNELHVLAQASKDLLREKIMEIYFKNVHTKTLTIYERGALDLYQQDYFAEGGNSYIPRFLEAMKTWKVIEDEDEA